MDASNQVIDGTQYASEFNGMTTVSFALPCNSPDTNTDVPLVGDHYFLFAHGGIRNQDVTYHGKRNRFFTPDKVHIDCEFVQRQGMCACKRLPTSIHLNANLASKLRHLSCDLFSLQK